MVETSVIIPAYNAAEYLEKCVSSVLEQTRRDLEVIVVNDGSTDRTPELCEQLRNRDSRVRVMHKKNGGLSSARNLGLEVATGEYVFFLDADDWLSEACLADLHALREKTNADIVIANFVSFDEEKGLFTFYSTDETYYEETYTPKELFTHENDARDNFHTSFIHAWDKLYRKELFLHVRYPEGMLAEDDYTTWKLYLLSDKIAYLNKAEYFYRVHDGSIMTSSPWDKVFPLKSIEQRIAVLSMLGFDISRELTAYKDRLQGQEQTLLDSGTKNLEAYQEVMWMKQVFEKYHV
ncbi:MAG: glycosyltransferase family 2 protein [Oribacterium sp.]|nr:glycosyltransferase family 2 protein [Oribacterium sp.]